MKHKWEIAYQNQDFKITSTEPSLLVKKYHQEILTDGDIVLDAGCGAGRNSIFLAKQGYKVDAFDIADLDWTDNLTPEVKEKITFSKSTTNEFNWTNDKYKLVISSRLIQYLNEEELKNFFEELRNSLKENGSLLLSYTTEGGIFSQQTIDVFKFSYPIEYIETLLFKYFKKIEITEGSKINTSVNYVDSVQTYDIRASDLK